MNNAQQKSLPVVGKLYKNRGRDIHLNDGFGKLGAGSYVLVLGRRVGCVGEILATVLVPRLGVVAHCSYWEKAGWDYWWEEVEL